MSKTLSIKNINTSPALTWNWLKMNRASVEVDADENVIRDSKEICSSQVIHLNFEDGKNYIHEQTVTAEEGKEITVILDYSSLPNAGGFSTIKTKLIAKPYSKIHLVKVQLLGSNFVQIDETYGECDDNARIEVTQIELGGSKVFAQVKNELKGYKSKFNSSTAYITKDNQVLDLNYVSNHTGAATETKMIVKGVVDGKSSKTYRGTIDFKNGCAGAVGDEQEEVLILSPAAVNKSLPTILCDEEDVSGTHGATLGRLGNEELFYFQSRGISEKEAEKIMTRAKVMAVAQNIPHEQTVEKIKKYLGEE